MKRVLSLSLAVVMLLSCVAILSGCVDPHKHSDANADYLCDECKEVLTNPNGYTYNTYLSTFPTKWNPHTYETSTDSEIIGYTELGFYTFDYNENKDGFVVVPEMAVGMPVDVTADYIGDEWGIYEGETARVWKIVLRDDLRWEDGKPITAHDFVTSAKLLLNPDANNYRADSLYEGKLAIAGARAYFYGGKYVELAESMVPTYADSEYVLVADLTLNADGQYTTDRGDLWFNVDDGGSWSTNPLSLYADYGYFADGVGGTAATEAAWDAIAALADKNGNVKVTPEVATNLMNLVAHLHVGGGATADDYAAALEAAGEDGGYAYLEWEEFIYYGYNAERTEFDTVGVKALSDTELVLILESPLEGFYLHYNLTGSWLVREDLYNQCISIVDGVYTSTYGTSVETYMSYGPYKLVSFIRDKQIVLDKNPEWYGHQDVAYEGTYQTTRIVYDYISEPSTAMEAFLQGKLDAKGLDVDQIKEYANSKHVYYTDGASTFFIAINPDNAAYTTWEADNAGKDKQILTVKEFRMALSFSLDRRAFNLACDPTGNDAFAVFNNMICSDPDTGTMYRTTEQAKDVMLEFWGISQDDIGEGKKYATKDDAIASITGYNLAGAKELFNQAYDYAIAHGLMSETDVVEICIGLPSATAKFYTNGYDFLVKNWTEAVEGTKLEGKLTFTKDDTIGNEFADKLKINQVNLLFGVGWTGSSLDPYGLVGAYTYPNYQYDPSWNTKAEMLDIEIGGKTYRASVYAWSAALDGSTIEIVEVGEDGMATDTTVKFNGGTYCDSSIRLDILAACEGAILRTYDMIPINNQSSAALKGMQIKYYTEEYVYGVGRGGIKYMTYNYTDGAWEAFVAAQGGVVNYK